MDKLKEKITRAAKKCAGPDEYESCQDKVYQTFSGLYEIRRSCFRQGADFATPLAMKEGFMEAMDYFARKGDGATLFDLAEYGKKIGILDGK
jgi:hypothetical protein